MIPAALILICSNKACSFNNLIIFISYFVQNYFVFKKAFVGEKNNKKPARTWHDDKTILAADSVLEDLLADLVSTASFIFVEIVSDIFTERWLRKGVANHAVIVGYRCCCGGYRLRAFCLDRKLKIRGKKTGKFLLVNLRKKKKQRRPLRVNHSHICHSHQFISRETSMKWKIYLESLKKVLTAVDFFLILRGQYVRDRSQ